MLDRVRWWEEYDDLVPVVFGHYWRRSGGRLNQAQREYVAAQIGAQLTGVRSWDEFIGTRIVVDPDAQKTDAYQSNRNLMLSDEAEANSLPGLEIRANAIIFYESSGPIRAIVTQGKSEMALIAELSGEELLDTLRATPATEYLVVEPTGEIYGVLSTVDVERAFIAAMGRSTVSS